MAHFLEVIVTSVQDAVEAQKGGADRLELVRGLEAGGLTPPLDLVEAVLAAVEIPVRVMLRESPTMFVRDAAEMSVLRSDAQKLAKLPIDGLVAGFLRGDSVDIKSMLDVLAEAGECKFTFHRAFDELPDPLIAIWQMKGFKQIDRILTVGGAGEWTERKQRLLEWQIAALPELKILTGAGLSPAVLSELKDTPVLSEVHVGRAARVGKSVEGRVDAEAVRALKSTLQ